MNMLGRPFSGPASLAPTKKYATTRLRAPISAAPMVQPPSPISRSRTAEVSAGPDTLPEEDFKHACVLMAGRMAEVLFDTDNLRLASSLDEVIKVRLLGRNISK